MNKSSLPHKKGFKNLGVLKGRRKTRTFREGKKAIKVKKIVFILKINKMRRKGIKNYKRSFFKWRKSLQKFRWKQFSRINKFETSAKK